MVYIFFTRDKTLTNFYNGQWLIRDSTKSWPSIRFEYVVCIFLLLRSIVTLGIDDDYVVCRCSRYLRNRKGDNAIGKKVGVHHIGL
jgi:hypothetical protein